MAILIDEFFGIFWLFQTRLPCTKNLLIFRNLLVLVVGQFPHSFVDPLLGGSSFMIKCTVITWCKQTGKLAALAYSTMMI
jgi:hypothetical protein